MGIQVLINDTAFDIIKQALEHNENLSIKNWSGQELQIISRHKWQDIFETNKNKER